MVWYSLQSDMRTEVLVCTSHYKEDKFPTSLNIPHCKIHIFFCRSNDEIIRKHKLYVHTWLKSWCLFMHELVQFLVQWDIICEHTYLGFQCGCESLMADMHVASLSCPVRLKRLPGTQRSDHIGLTVESLGGGNWGIYVNRSRYFIQYIKYAL